MILKVVALQGVIGLIVDSGFKDAFVVLIREDLSIDIVLRQGG